jgi:putative membrane protein
MHTRSGFATRCNRYNKRGESCIAVETLESRQLLSISPAAVPAGLSARDVAWIHKSDSSDALEVALGNLSQTQAASPDVKAAGARMAADHTASKQSLESAAAALGVTVNGMLDPQDKAIVTRMTRLNGTQFDEAYSQYMVPDHKQDIASYTTEANTTSNTTLKQVATAEIPVLQSHLALWQSTEITPRDVNFVARAASGNMLESTLGTLAQANSSNVAVKSAGQTMTTDHTASESMLATDAAALGLTLPGGMNAADQAVYNRLSRLTGAQFDRVYSTYMVADHQRELSMYTIEDRSVSEANLKAYTTAQLPVLRSHLSLWQATVQSVRSGG